MSDYTISYFLLGSASARLFQQSFTGHSQIRRETSFYDIMSNKILSTAYRTDHPYERAMLLGKIITHY